MIAECVLFWEQATQVERFAAREPDKRLLKLLEQYESPRTTRILDLGCAGGRNALLLAQQDFDFYALDSSRAMVEKTRNRVSLVQDATEAKRRIRHGEMADLSAFEAEFFDLVIALGLYQNATSWRELESALAETARVFKTNGELLVANFSPRCQPNGQSLRKLPEPDVYDGFSAGPMLLLEAKQLDAALAKFGLFPLVATETVVVKTDPGQRVTVNGLYRKAEAG